LFDVLEVLCNVIEIVPKFFDSVLRILCALYRVAV